MKKGHFRVVFFSCLLPPLVSIIHYINLHIFLTQKYVMIILLTVNLLFLKPHPVKCSEELLSIHIAVNTFPEFSLAKLKLYILFTLFLPSI